MYAWGIGIPMPTVHVEYAEQRIKDGILFIFRLFYEFVPREYVRGVRVNPRQPQRWVSGGLDSLCEL